MLIVVYINLLVGLMFFIDDVQLAYNRSHTLYFVSQLLHNKSCFSSIYVCSLENGFHWN